MDQHIYQCSLCLTIEILPNSIHQKKGGFYSLLVSLAVCRGLQVIGLKDLPFLVIAYAIAKAAVLAALLIDPGSVLSTILQISRPFAFTTVLVVRSTTQIPLSD